METSHGRRLSQRATASVSNRAWRALLRARPEPRIEILLAVGGGTPLEKAIACHALFAEDSVFRHLMGDGGPKAIALFGLLAHPVPSEGVPSKNGLPGYDAPAVPCCNGPPGYGPPPTSAAPHCSDCRFFGAAGAPGSKPSTTGICHRFPQMGGHQILVSKDHWGGEFSRKA